MNALVPAATAVGHSLLGSYAIDVPTPLRARASEIETATWISSSPEPRRKDAAHNARLRCGKPRFCT